MIDWPQVLWTLTVATAVAGGVFSLAAYIVRQRAASEEDGAKRAHIMYLASYVLMSISIFFFAARALVE